jgi:PAS domain S-box-containing protein
MRHTDIDCSALVALSADAIIASDAQGRIVLWNAAAERIFGYSEAEALGRLLDLITPERLRHRHWEGYEKSMATGTTKYGSTLLRVPATHKDGRALSIAFTVAMLFGADGKVSSVVAVIRDETERFNEERALRKRVMELQAQVQAGAQGQAP